MTSVQEIPPEQVADLTMSVESEVIYSGVQANVIKGNSVENGNFIIVNLPFGDSLLIRLS